jgi:serine/threonine protein kinase
MTSDRITSGSVIGGRFEIERLACAGGMGDVFRAKDQRTGEPAAVKFVRNGDALL